MDVYVIALLTVFSLVLTDNIRTTRPHFALMSLITIANDTLSKMLSQLSSVMGYPAFIQILRAYLLAKYNDR